MIYRIKSNENLFNEWRKYEEETKEFLLASLVQNDMLLTTQQLNDSFSVFHQTITELKGSHSNIYVRQITYLRDKTVDYINNLNKLPLSDWEFSEFRTHCKFYQPQYEGFGDQKASTPSIHNCSSTCNNGTEQDNCTLKYCPFVFSGVVNS